MCLMPFLSAMGAFLRKWRPTATVESESLHPRFDETESWENVVAQKGMC